MADNNTNGPEPINYKASQSKVDPRWLSAMGGHGGGNFNPPFSLTKEYDYSSPEELRYYIPPIPMNSLANKPNVVTPDATLALLQSMLSNTADTSGYDAILNNIADQRKQTQKRYQTYSAQISDLFGNLGRKSTTYAQEQAGITEAAAATRSQMAAMQAQQAQQTRDADAARLKAANEARIALGGEAAGPEGDIATQNIEKSLTDQQSLGQTTIDTILANEALAKLMSSRQAGGFDIAGQQAQQQLNMSYEDMLASLAGQQAQTQLQKSQAISAGKPSISEQLSVMDATQKYLNAKANSGTGSDPATIWIQANPKSAETGSALMSYFVPWFTSEAPAVGQSGKTPTLNELVTTFAKANPDAATILANDPALYSLLQAYTGLK